MAITIAQGDSYPIFFNLQQDGAIITPSMVGDIEVLIGENLRYTRSSGSVGYDAKRKRWYVWPTQQETLSVEGSCTVYVRVKYLTDPSEVYGFKVGTIIIRDTECSEVL